MDNSSSIGIPAIDPANVRSPRRPPSALSLRIAEELEAAREATLPLIHRLPDAAPVAEHSPLMSPIVWDLAYIANYEEYWLVRSFGGRPLPDSAFEHVYDPQRNPRSMRHRLPLLTPDQARAYLGDFREATRETLEAVAFDSGDPLIADGYVYGIVIQHEHQHVETMLAAVQLMEGTYLTAGDYPSHAVPPAKRHIFVEPGFYPIGTSEEAWTYDNERELHCVKVAPFTIDACPVTNGEFLEFMEIGGCWATHPTAIRTTFRNWDYRDRRQIFAGFQCASDG